jgi:hypothetical protein
MEKCDYYRNAEWAKRERMVEWSRDSYYSLNKRFRVHNVYDYPSWLLRFRGPHPEEITRLRSDINKKIVSIEVRKNDDVEDFIDSFFYKLIGWYFRLADRPDELIQKARHILGRIVWRLLRTVDAKGKKIINYLF